MKNKLRASLMGFVAGCTMLGTLATPYDALACPHRHHRHEPLCLAVNDGNQNLFNLKIERHSMFDPDNGETRIAKGTVNGLEPILGLALETSAHSVVVNLQGTVAGFFSAMQFNYNPDAGTGTGRVLGELSAHAHVTVTEYRCH